MDQVNFPYPYTVKRSNRAKHVRLVISSEGFTVVVPARFPVERDLRSVLESKIDWIRKTFEKVNQSALLMKAVEGVPTCVELKALNECWHVHKRVLGKERILEQVEQGERLLLLTSEYSESEATAALRRWLLCKAREVLPIMLSAVAERHGFTFAGVTVKEQKSIWGSCSASGNINLNARLLFLEARLVQHVLLHELCHLKEMSHSSAFYKLLTSLDPQTSESMRSLKEAWSFIPRWVLS